MSNEYYAVILEFHSQEIKLGFVGESTEHVRVTSESSLWKKLVPPTGAACATSPAFLQVDSHAIPSHFRRELLENLVSSDTYGDPIRAYERDQKSRKWFAWHQDDYATLSTIVRTLLSTNLLVSPLKTKLFVVDASMATSHKASLCKTFLASKTAVSLTFLPFSPCCCMAAGVENALVVALDWEMCTLVPVLDLRSLPAKEYVQFSGESMHYSPAISHRGQSFEDVEHAIKTKETIVETAFFAGNSLSRAIAAVVKSLEMDSRSSVAANIIFTGMRSHIPGIKGRLLTEIAAHLPNYEVSGKVCLGAWAGASLYCSTTLLKEKGPAWRHMEIFRTNERTSAIALESYHA